MRSTEDPLTITARAYPADQFADATFSWKVSDSTKLQLTPSSDTKSCECKFLEAVQGGITLTVSCYGKEYSIPVYLVN